MPKNENEPEPQPEPTSEKAPEATEPDPRTAEQAPEPMETEPEGEPEEPEPEGGPEPSYTDLDFEYNPYQENVAIMGLQGEGKTTMAHNILASIPSIPRTIWSPQRPMHLYGRFGDPVSKIGEIGRHASIYTGEYSAANFDRYCERIMQLWDIVCVWDDIHEYCGKQKIPENFARIINSGRNRGICSIFLSPSPNLVNNVILQSSQHIFCFRMNLESQIEWVRKNYFGRDAWVLLPRHLRRERPTIGDRFDVLPKHSYLYKKLGDLHNTLIVAGGGATA